MRCDLDMINVVNLVAHKYAVERGMQLQGHGLARDDGQKVGGWLTNSDDSLRIKILLVESI